MNSISKHFYKQDPKCYSASFSLNGSFKGCPDTRHMSRNGLYNSTPLDGPLGIVGNPRRRLWGCCWWWNDIHANNLKPPAQMSRLAGAIWSLGFAIRYTDNSQSNSTMSTSSLLFHPLPEDFNERLIFLISTNKGLLPLKVLKDLLTMFDNNFFFLSQFE